MAGFKDRDNQRDLYDILFNMNSAIVGDPNQVSITNDPFAFNPNSVRVGSTTEGYGTPLSDMNTRSIKLTRGFIRNLVTDLGGDFPKFKNLRCHFQFNPQDIMHSIQARSDMYLPILQDPAQLRQPMAGNATFEFELVFDRTMEVNSNVSSSRQEVINSADGTVGTVAFNVDPTDVNSAGVFHDLKILYSIIGQGLSEELLESQVEKLRQDLRSYASRNYSELNVQASFDANGVPSYSPTYYDSESSVSPGATETSRVADPNANITAGYLNSIANEPDATLGSFVSEINVGNSAFLIPQPVRVIFSPVFMVDGFVMNTKVLFTKFSAHMIPTQCKVFLQMQAIYMGFARARTFLSEQLSITTNQNTSDYNTADEEINSMYDLLKRELTSIRFGYSSDDQILREPDDLGPPEVREVNAVDGESFDSYFGFQPIWMVASRGFWYTRPIIPYSSDTDMGSVEVPGFPTYELDFDNKKNTPSFPPGISVAFTKRVSEYLKSSIFEELSNANPRISLDTEHRIYGPFNSQSLAEQFVSGTLGENPAVFPTQDDVTAAGAKWSGHYRSILRFFNTDTWDKYTKEPFSLTAALTTGEINTWNTQNEAPDYISPATPNSSGKTIAQQFIEDLDDISQTYSIDNDSKDAILKMYLPSRSNFASTEMTRDAISNQDPDVLTDWQYIEGILPDSLLTYVEDVLDLGNKYFVVCTTAQVKWSINDGQGSNIYREGSSKKSRTSTVVKGSTTGFTHDVELRYS